MTGCEDYQALAALMEELEDIRDMFESAGEPTRPLREHLSRRVAHNSGRTAQAANILAQLCEQGQVGELTERIQGRLLGL